MQHVLRIVQGQQLFTIYRVQLEMCHSTWIDYNQSMLTLEVIRDNDIWHIFIYKDVRKFWFASYGRTLSFIQIAEHQWKEYIVIFYFFNGYI